METNEDKRTEHFFKFGNVLRVILGIVTCLLVWLLVHCEKITILMGSKLTFVSLLLLTLFITGLQVMERKSSRNGKKSFYGSIFCVCYVCSFVLIVLEQFHTLYGLWMLGGWILSIAFNTFVGMVFQTLFCLANAWLGQYNIESFSLLFLFSVGMCFLVPYMKKMSNIGYVILIGLICNAIVIVLQEDFRIQQIFQLETVWWEIACFITLLASAFSTWLLLGITKYGTVFFAKEGIQEFLSTEEELLIEGTTIKVGDLVDKHQNKEIQLLKPLLQKNYVLLKRLQEELPDVYRHSLLVAEAAKEAAKCVNADQKICYAGGLYHEIGKLESKDYVNAGILLGKTNHFPKRLLLVIEEHNIRMKVSTSKEAAVVMLTDSVVSMLQRTESKKQKEQQKEMVKRIFILRLEQGALDQCGLSVIELKNLLEVFIDWVEKRV